LIEQSQNGGLGSNPGPSERSLTSPLEQSSEPSEDAWLVVARNSRVNSSWEALCSRNLEDSKRCYRHLSLTPTERKPGKIFPLRGHKYKGAWEYEFSSGDRVFYVPDTSNRKVEVYYADKHPKKKAPEP
jgi:hypothetical protein